MTVTLLPATCVSLFSVNDTGKASVGSVCLVFINHPCPKMGAAASGSHEVSGFPSFLGEKKNPDTGHNSCPGEIKFSRPGIHTARGAISSLHFTKDPSS